MQRNQALKFSYEFFPPRSARMERRLWRTMGQLERLRPEFFSMTYGALGSAQQISVDTALAMHRESPVAVAAHLTGAGADRAAVLAVARQLQSAGVRRIVALRGDTPDGDDAPLHAFPSAVELVAALRRIDDFDISVAAYPEPHPDSRGRRQDLEHLRRKFDAGATRAITQYFFEPDCFLRLRDAAARAGIAAPIVPGILPVHDLDRVREFSRRCGASVPAGFGPLFERAGDDAGARYRLAIELAVELCESLRREGVGQIHFYTLNQSDLCLDISLALGAIHATGPVESAA